MPKFIDIANALKKVDGFTEKGNMTVLFEGIISNVVYLNNGFVLLTVCNPLLNNSNGFSIEIFLTAELTLKYKNLIVKYNKIKCLGILKYFAGETGYVNKFQLSKNVVLTQINDHAIFRKYEIRNFSEKVAKARTIYLVHTPKSDVALDFSSRFKNSIVPKIVHETVKPGYSDLCHVVKQLLNKKRACIVIVRGGGPDEVLFPFNDLELARIIGEAEIPIFCAVGHTKDHVLATAVSFFPPNANDYIFDTPSNISQYLFDNIKP